MKRTPEEAVMNVYHLLWNTSVAVDLRFHWFYDHFLFLYLCQQYATEALCFPVVRPSVKTYFAWHDISLLAYSWRISKKPATNIHHWVGKVLKIRGQMSRTNVYKYVNIITAEAYISKACGVDAHSC